MSYGRSLARTAGYAAAGMAGRSAYRTAANTIQRFFKSSAPRRRQMVGSRRLRMNRVIGNDYHLYTHTMNGAWNFQAGSSGIIGNALAGTTASTANPGFNITFTPYSFSVTNANSGSQTYTLPNASSYQAIYDQVRIKQIRLKFILSGTQAAVSTSASTSAIPNLLLANDADDANVPVAASDVLDYRAHKICQLTGPCNWSCYPKYQIGAGQAASTTDTNVIQLSQRGAWINNSVSAGQTLKHYGVKGFMDLGDLLTAAGGVNPYIVGCVNLYVTFVLEFKGIKA